MPLTLESKNMNIIKWWVDASHAVHPDMRSHTGAMMTLGKGAVYATSVRQKLNTKSTTESELVGVDDIMAQKKLCKYLCSISFTLQNLQFLNERKSFQKICRLRCK